MIKENFSFLYKKGERKTVILSALLLFAMTCAFVILKSARDALFLSHYPARVLPYFMAITPVATAIVSASYLRLYKALSLRDAVEVSIWGFIVGTFLLWLAIKMKMTYATPILYVWAGVFGSLAPVQAWSVIGQQLLTRQARRAFGFVGAGGIAGASAGGFITKWISQGFSVSSLIPAAVLMILTGLFVERSLSKKGSASVESEKTGAVAPVHTRYVIYVLIIVGIASITTTWADFQFKVTAQSRLTTAPALASFFGSFNAYINIATLAFQIFLTQFFINRLGVASALGLLPCGLAIGNTWMLVSASLGAAVLLKGSEQVFRFSIYRSSLELLYMAIPERTKVRLKSLIDTVAVRTAEGAAGLVLILLFSVGKFPLAVLAFLSLILLAMSLACSYLLNREYRQALGSAIRREEMAVPATAVKFRSEELGDWLPGLVQSGRRQTVLDLLQDFHKSGGHQLQKFLLPLLDHPDAEIRLRSLQLLFDQRQDLSQEISRLTSDPDRRVRVEAIHYLCFQSSIDPIEKLAHLLVDPDPMIQAAACACSLNQEMGPAQQLAYERLEELLRDPDPDMLEARIEVAHILEYVKPSPSSTELCRKLLSDPHPEVRRATLHSISETRPAGILPSLLELISDPSLRTEVRNALAAYGEMIAPDLKRILENKDVPLEQKKLVLRIAGDIDSSETVDLLMKCALGSNLVLRFVATKSLNRIKKRGVQALPKDQLLALLEQEVTALEIEQQRHNFISPDATSLLHSVLNQRKTWARERIFRVLALLYEPKGIYNAYLALSGKDKRRTDSALEFLDASLAPDHRSRILALLEFPRAKEKASLMARKNVLLGYLGAGDQLPAAAMITDLSYSEFFQFRTDIAEALNAFPGLALVKETFLWRSARMDTPGRKEEKLTTIQKLEYLNHVDIFSRLGPQELLLLANQSIQCDFKEGDVVYKEGEPGDDLYILATGRMELKRHNGRSTYVNAGQTFSTLSVVSDQPRLFTATALNPSLCLKISKNAFWEILEDYPSVSQAIFKVLARQIRELTEEAPAENLRYERS